MNAKEVTIFPDEIDYDSICSNFVNPMTVCGFIDIYQKNEYKAIVQSAACSSLGKMLVRFCKKLNIPLINIVRREEQAKILEDIGAENILNSSSDTFAADLRSLSHQLEAKCFFDAIGGGADTALVLDVLPSGTTTYIYGMLGGQNLTYSGGKMIFKEITINFFWLGPWLRDLSEDERTNWVNAVISDLSLPSESSIFQTKIAKTFPLEEINDALKAAVELASEGKVLIKPNQN